MLEAPPFLAALSCPRCGAPADPLRPGRYRGCPSCAAEGVAVNLACEPPSAEAVRLAVSGGEAGDAPGLWRYAAALPVPLRSAVSLGEGGTPLVALPRLAEELGVGELLVKNEAANPTWSHKDRLSALAVSAAVESGARVVTGSSTGNHGASLAAYSARAGLACVIFTLESVPQTMKILMQSFGAEVVALGTLAERYELMRQCVDRYGWYCATNAMSPPVGSDSYGVDGYKTIAYELYEQLGGRLPDWMVIPVAYGDTLSGVVRGFRDLQRAGLVDGVPRVVAAEAFTAVKEALATETEAIPEVSTRPTAAFSIATPYTTAQAVRAVRATEGVAESAGEEELLAMQMRLGREGLFAEAASCVPFVVAARLVADGVIGREESVVCLATSSALKDPAASLAGLRTVPRVEPTVEALKRALREREASRAAHAIESEVLFSNGLSETS